MFRYSAIGAGVLIALFGELMILVPTHYVVWVTLATLFITLFLWRLLRPSGSRSVSFGMGGATLLFVLAGFALLLFIEQTIFQHLLVVCIIGACGFITQNVYTFIHVTDRYHPYALETIFSYVNLLTLFFLLSAVQTVMLLFSFSVWPFALVIAVVAMLISFQTFWVYKAPIRDALGYAVPVSIMTLEMFVAVSFLPGPPLALASLTTIMYYLFMNILREHIAQRMELKTIRIYLVVSLALIAAVIISSPWR
ncbi:MAG: hypothetical protein A2898_02815 [Candidatus Kerfeldbacteria bacterium RIFCSPLOWO2_01_FULL_48_11]|uniref:Uncharacterized protein n=1 Tax=Candidatus Kerfeldbacteria bacterium RIFCSPLOWO2_01_FULL_48_11 TaxID=1798543 RepID=A0A1G2B753_9BACT|nr:MAG: hypothetical protein UY34_C0011G0037 [Parcubacteria group bacterium GW2011_GWA2_48_9]KKW13943.1 MAG: hypothetical protein UY52_C0034G0003 [Parcubacteria group bacterium GW2011_GWC2_49_9]OGY85038.1 MAG: hypothetical protein A2898_02815 [Candidatus Kerfeldbacteria bacterium RIFCSPLOWO2_01_FULL_48_11]HCJ52582.1 hypothetical protein [Candidatus Kerfeldbacteria bacterium]HCM68661.1 hypothetical protein [Candidatus Kerfeldbacteria bacterium]